MILNKLRSELIGKASQLEMPFLEVRLIIEKATGFDQLRQIAEGSSEIPDEKCKEAFDMLSRRLSGTPMAYITGKKEFYGNTFSVSPSVLIPRPDTETLVEAALDKARLFSSARILDLCTGSGAVGVSIAKASGLDVFLSDISEDALSIASQNYRTIIGHDGDIRKGSLFEPWKGMRFDIIASNPPYLTEKWWEETERDVKAEPLIAFIGHGDDGLDIIRRIIDESPLYLAEGGFLMLECDYRQTSSCAILLENRGFEGISIVKDLAGKERVVYGRLPK
ncbi:MAG: peptide chain release factor N(5)-glutamine methyltransferase [Candidatus Ornithospirochaeta sp.]|nr:peptide chain release factor N(5)-glutamine methyltransferase [Candidatus Ornithospirochaeta sp.]